MQRKNKSQAEYSFSTLSCVSFCSRMFINFCSAEPTFLYKEILLFSHLVLSDSAFLIFLFKPFFSSIRFCKF